jgi:pyrroloquinoline quinone biosynthesis protein D
MNPRLPRGVRLRNDTVRKRWVLLAPERIFEVDDVGVEILKRCDGRSHDQLLTDLALAFSATPDDIRADVERFLNDFAQKRILDLV